MWAKYQVTWKYNVPAVICHSEAGKLDDTKKLYNLYINRVPYMYWGPRKKLNKDGAINKSQMASILAALSANLQENEIAVF